MFTLDPFIIFLCHMTFYILSIQNNIFYKSPVAQHSHDCIMHPIFAARGLLQSKFCITMLIVRWLIYFYHDWNLRPRSRERHTLATRPPWCSPPHSHMITYNVHWIIFNIIFTVWHFTTYVNTPFLDVLHTWWIWYMLVHVSTSFRLYSV